MSEALLGTVLADRFEMLEILGRGAWSVVYEAHDRVTRTDVALKVLTADAEHRDEWKERMRRELAVSHLVSHPNVCRIHELGEAGGEVFLSMQLAPGGDLKTRLEGRSLPPLPERVAELRQALAGVAALHAKGIVHRDIKPANFLVMDGGRLALSDFGIARTSDTHVTVVGGTSGYLAPESDEGDLGTTRSDVFALGTVAHEILFGCLPKRKGGRRLVRPAAAKGREGRRLFRLCAECLDRDPAERPASAGEILRRLDEHGVVISRRWWGLGAAAAVIAGAWLLSSPSPAFIEPRGTPEDWSGLRSLAQVAGRIHCLSRADEGARIVWGDPRRAEDVDLTTGERRPARLRPEAFRHGCPQLSPDRKQLAFDGFDRSGRAQIQIADPDGSGARPLTAGMRPLWLPSGDEILLNLDEHFAAVYSISQTDLRVLSDGGVESATQMIDKAVDPDGRILALSYIDKAFQGHLVLRSLPSLSLLTDLRFTRPPTDLRFEDARHLRLGLLAPEGTRMAVVLDMKTHAVTARGRIPGFDLRASIGPTVNEIVVEEDRRRDVWIVGGDAPARRVTSDGRAGHASLGPQGDVLVSHARSAGGVIRFPANGEPAEVLVAGPYFSPAHLPDGTGWVAGLAGKPSALVRCTFPAHCAPLPIRGELLASPTPEPDGARLAHLEADTSGAAWLVVTSAAGEATQLGRVEMACPPRWAARDLVWAVTGGERQIRWVEWNASTGRPTGKSAAVGTDCGSDDVPAGWASRRRAVIKEETVSRLRIR